MPETHWKPKQLQSRFGATIRFGPPMPTGGLCLVCRLCGSVRCFLLLQLFVSLGCCLDYPFGSSFLAFNQFVFGYYFFFMSLLRISTRRILPLIVFGSSSTNSIMRGYL